MTRRNLITNPELHPDGPTPAGVWPSGGAGAVTFGGTTPDTYARWTLTTAGSGFSCGLNLHPALGVTTDVTPGAAYSARITMRHKRAHQLRAHLQFLNGFTLLESTELGDTPAAGEWVTYTWNGVVAPANTTAIRLLAYQSTSGLLVGDTLDVRDALVVQDTTAGDFFSGTTGGTWDGTAHASTSTEASAEPEPAPGDFEIVRSSGGILTRYEAVRSSSGTVTRLEPVAGAVTPAPELAPEPVAGTFATGLPREVFAPDSFWYKPLPSNAPLDPASATKRDFLIATGIASWGNASKGYPSFALNNYANTPPIVVVTNNDPIINGGAGMTLRDTGTGPYFDNLRTMFQGVRLPAGFVHDVGGSDGFLIVYNADTDTYWDFWVVEKDAAGYPGWSAMRGHRIDNASTKDGITEPYGSSAPYYYYGSNAAGLCEVGGVIKLEELEEGLIPHVINMAVPVSCVAHKTTVGISAPATRSDGASLEPGAIQMGQRVRLPAGFDVDTPNYHPVTRTVARAFRDYGAIVMDRAGDISFRGENKTGIVNGSARWGAVLEGASPHDVMWDHGGHTPFPWSSLQVLAPDYLVP